MSYEPKVARIDRFAGMSDRSHPAGTTRVENPKLLNVDFSERKPRRRYGFTRVNTERFKDGSIRLDGINDYIRIKNQTAYQPVGADTFYVGIGVVLRKKPTAAVTIAMRGRTNGGGVNIQWQIQYSPSTATNVNGAWVFTLYDPVTPLAHVAEIADGDGGLLPVDQFRYLEMYVDLVLGAPVMIARMKREDDTTVLSGGVAPIQGGVTTTEDILLGVSMSAANTIGTDFAAVSLCEFRYYVGTIATVEAHSMIDATYAPLKHRRELVPAEHSMYTGYWKLNDGNMTGILADLGTGGNNATIPANPASWVQADGLTIGQSGIQFFGHDAFLALWNTNAVPYLQNPFSTTGAGQVQRWTVRGIFVPKLAAGEATVRDQTIFWAGQNAAIPGPVGLEIVANTWTATYRDGAANQTRTLTGAVFGPTALVNKQVRWAISRFGTGNGTLRLALSWKDSSGVQQQTFSDLALPSGATPSLVSGFWHIGRTVSSVVLPYAYAGAGGAFGIIDDFQVIHTNSLTASPVSHGGNLAFTETASWGFPHFVVAHIKMNEGGGNFAIVTSETPQTLQAFLYPEENEGAHWDVGLVRPYRSPECGGIFDFNRFLPNGSTKRTKLINSGCTWYEVDAVSGLAMAIGATPRAATKWTKAQYAQTAFLASDNGQRPVKYDGTGFENLGIRAPLSAPVLSDAAGGTFTGTYWFYVTFYNKSRNVESNPGPGVSYTLTSRQITQVIIPTSSDPQVTGRRLYVTLGNGADGSLAFLLKEFDDNTQVTWGAATSPFTMAGITAPVSSGRVLEYFDREEAPEASLVHVFGDNLFVAGHSVFPTRIYRSAVGEPDYFNQNEKNVDLDLDTGDPIVGMKPLVDSLFVGLRDGWGRVANSGNSDNPINRAILSRDHGPVGAHAMVAVDRIVYYVSERDIFRTDGLTDDNISSPYRADMPSIQEFMKTRINSRRRGSIVMAQYKGRKQLWIAYSSVAQTRNDRVLVYELAQGVWSDYELGLDFVTELEDENDDPVLFGASEGYLVKLDQSNQSDGVGTIRRLDVTAFTADGDCPYITYSGAEVSNAHGALAFCYKKSTNAVLAVRCEYSQTNKLRFYKSDLGLAAGDVVIVGGIRFQMDWVLDFGESIKQKRVRSLRIAGKSSDANMKMRLQYAPHQAERSPSFTTATTRTKTWASGADMLRFEMGGLFRTLRLRLTESDDADGIFSEDPWVSTVTTPAVLYELAAHAEVMDIEA